MGETKGKMRKPSEGVNNGRPLRQEVTGLTTEGDGNWERREWEPAWGKMEKEEVGKDRNGDTVMW